MDVNTVLMEVPCESFGYSRVSSVEVDVVGPFQDLFDVEAVDAEVHFLALAADYANVGYW